MRKAKLNFEIYTPLTAEQLKKVMLEGQFMQWMVQCCSKQQREECKQTGKCAFAAIHYNRGGYYSNPEWLCKNCDQIKLNIEFDDLKDRVDEFGKRHTSKSSRIK